MCFVWICAFVFSRCIVQQIYVKQFTKQCARNIQQHTKNIQKYKHIANTFKKKHATQNANIVHKMEIDQTRENIIHRNTTTTTNTYKKRKHKCKSTQQNQYKHITKTIICKKTQKCAKQNRAQHLKMKTNSVHTYFKKNNAKHNRNNRTHVANIFKLCKNTQNNANYYYRKRKKNTRAKKHITHTHTFKKM